MQPGRCRVVAFATALLMAFPFAALGQGMTVSYAFKSPAGWARAGLGGQAYFVRDGDKLHTLSVASVPKSDLEAYVAERLAAERTRGADVVDDGPTTVCDGEAAHRWTVRSASTGVPMEIHFLAATVTGGLGLVSYGHRQDVGDRHDGLEAMTNVCPGPFPNPVPAGWTAPKSRFGTISTLDSPDATSTFVAAYRPLTQSAFAAFERDSLAGGKAVSDRREPCGSASVHRVDLQIGGQVSEMALALVHGFGYRYVYTRPATHEADAGAERALTAFCRASGPLPGASSAPV